MGIYDDDCDPMPTLRKWDPNTPRTIRITKISKVPGQFDKPFFKILGSELIMENGNENWLEEEEFQCSQGLYNAMEKPCREDGKTVVTITRMGDGLQTRWMVE